MANKFSHKGKRYVEVPAVDRDEVCTGCALSLSNDECEDTDREHLEYEEMINCVSRETIAIRDTKAGREGYLVAKTRHRIGVKEDE